MIHYEDETTFDEIHKAYMETIDEALAHFRNDLSDILVDLIDEVRSVDDDAVVEDDDDDDF